MKNKNIIFCDGGLANRLNSLISGLKLAEILKGEWIICWPINEWCGAALDDLFKVDLPIINEKLSFFQYRKDELFFIMHEDQLKFNPKMYVNINGITSFDCLNLKMDRNYFYYNNLIPNFLSLKDINDVLNKISIKHYIKKQALDFIEKYEINNETIGLHIRKTDFGDAVNDKELFDLALSSEGMFFVCTDDILVSKKFSKLKNCAVYLHENYVGKRDENLNWNDLVSDNVGRIYNFNVSRNSESVKAALIDLLILSKTKIVNTSNSTFLKMAIIFKQINYI